MSPVVAEWMAKAVHIEPSALGFCARIATSMLPAYNLLWLGKN